MAHHNSDVATYAHSSNTDINNGSVVTGAMVTGNYNYVRGNSDTIVSTYTSMSRGYQSLHQFNNVYNTPAYWQTKLTDRFDDTGYYTA
jgi:hypothetical protein